MSPKKKLTILEHAEADTQAEYKENQALALRLRTVSAEARELRAEMDTIKRRLGIYEKMESAPFAPPEWHAPKAPGKSHRAIPTLFISDWHWGEVVDPAQIAGINAYNVAIARLRMKEAFVGALRVTRDYLKGVDYDGFHVALGGDILSGNIHDLRETNEGSVFENAFDAAEHIVAGLRLLADDAKRVSVDCVVGNHGRNTQKPIDKNRVRDNFDWLVYRKVADELKGDARIAVHISDSADSRFTLYDTRYLNTHGSDFHGGGGISAELSPLLLGVHRTTKRESDAGFPFDVMLCSHFHRHLFLGALGLIVNGCGVGYNERGYDKRYSLQPPQCGMWLTTVEHSITVSAPVFVANRAEENW